MLDVRQAEVALQLETRGPPTPTSASKFSTTHLEGKSHAGLQNGYGAVGDP